MQMIIKQSICKTDDVTSSTRAPGDNGQFKCEWLEIEWHKYAFWIIFTFSSHFFFSFASYVVHIT